MKHNFSVQLKNAIYSSIDLLHLCAKHAAKVIQEGEQEANRLFRGDIGFRYLTEVNGILLGDALSAFLSFLSRHFSFLFSLLDIVYSQSVEHCASTRTYFGGPRFYHNKQ